MNAGSSRYDPINPKNKKRNLDRHKHQMAARPTEAHQRQSWVNHVKSWRTGGNLLNGPQPTAHAWPKAARRRGTVHVGSPHTGSPNHRSTVRWVRLGCQIRQSVTKVERGGRTHARTYNGGEELGCSRWSFTRISCRSHTKN